MYWIIFYIIPLIVMWKKREECVAEALFSLYGTIIGVYLAVWLCPMVSTSLTMLPIMDEKFKAWLPSGSMILVLIIVIVFFKNAVRRILPEGFDFLSFPENWTKHLSKLFIFWNTVLVMSLLTVSVISSPAGQFVPFISEDIQVRSAVRYRILWNSFLIDRLSLQPVTVTMRRRAMDFYVSEFPEDHKVKKIYSDRNDKKNSVENNNANKKGKK